MTRRPIILLALVALLAILAGCSEGGKKDQPTIEPTVSTPADETPTPTLTGDFATAVKFIKLTHQDDYRTAAQLVVPESPAARYVAHQTLQRKAQRIAGFSGEDDPIPSVKADPATQTVKIRYRADEDGPAVKYTWRDFTYEQGKLTGWTGASGPVNDVLWSRTTSDSSRGVKAELASAYRSNNGSMNIVVELSADRSRGFGDAEYAAKGGYRQAVSGQSAAELSKGEKTLAYFVFEDAKFGGTLHIPYYDETGSSYGDWELKLAIK